MHTCTHTHTTHVRMHLTMLRKGQVYAHAHTKHTLHTVQLQMRILIQIHKEICKSLPDTPTAPPTLVGDLVVWRGQTG